MHQDKTLPTDEVLKIDEKEKRYVPQTAPSVSTVPPHTSRAPAPDSLRSGSSRDTLSSTCTCSFVALSVHFGGELSLPCACCRARVQHTSARTPANADSPSCRAEKDAPIHPFLLGGHCSYDSTPTLSFASRERFPLNTLLLGAANVNSGCCFGSVSESSLPDAFPNGAWELRRRLAEGEYVFPQLAMNTVYPEQHQQSALAKDDGRFYNYVYCSGDASAIRNRMCEAHSQRNRDKEAPTRDFLWMAKKRAAARSGERESVHSLSFNSRATCEQRTVSEATDTSTLRLVRGNGEGRTAFDPASIAGTQLSGIVFPSLPSDDCFAADNDASLVAQTLPLKKKPLPEKKNRS